MSASLGYNSGGDRGCPPSLAGVAAMTAFKENDKTLTVAAEAKTAGAELGAHLPDWAADFKGETLLDFAFFLMENEGKIVEKQTNSLRKKLLSDPDFGKTAECISKTIVSGKAKRTTVLDMNFLDKLASVPSKALGQ